MLVVVNYDFIMLWLAWDLQGSCTTGTCTPLQQYSEKMDYSFETKAKVINMLGLTALVYFWKTNLTIASQGYFHTGAATHN